MEPFLQYHPDTPDIRAVALVAHGLNVRPTAMLPLVQWLTGHGSAVYLTCLSGHHKGASPITEVTSVLWRKEMLTAYARARDAAARHGVPLYFLGYSLGALLGQSLIAEGAARFDRQVLLAPATALRRRSHLVRLLFFLGDHQKLPSYTPEAYRVNEALPLTIYRILFMEEKKVAAAAPATPNIPTLIVVDPRDELISYPKLLARRFPHYRVLALDPDLKGRNSRYHHLVIDEVSMGKANWERAIGEMKAFLFPSL